MHAISLDYKGVRQASADAPLVPTPLECHDDRRKSIRFGSF